jgi:hypothetical protein
MSQQPISYLELQVMKKFLTSVIQVYDHLQIISAS